MACLLKVLFLSQRAAHVYSEAKRVYAFKDTVSSNLKWVLSLDFSYSLYCVWILGKFFSVFVKSINVTFLIFSFL